MAINKIPVKKIVEFKRLSRRSQQTFANNLRKPRKKSDGGGGDYWVRSNSAISTAYKHKDNSIIKERLDALEDDYALPSTKQTKIMRKRNIEILEKYVGFDFDPWWPASDLKFLSQPSDKAVIQMNSLPIHVKPNHIFTYDRNGRKSIGGIWFVTWLDGFKPSDLGIFSEGLHRYLTINYSGDYIISPASCITVDVSTVQAIGYDKILSGEVPSLIDATVSDINECMSN